MEAPWRALRSTLCLVALFAVWAFGLVGCGGVTVPTRTGVAIDEIVATPPERATTVEVGAPIILKARTRRDVDVRGVLTYEWQAPRELDVRIEVTSPTSDYATLRAMKPGSGLVTVRLKLDGQEKDAKDVLLEVRPAATAKPAAGVAPQSGEGAASLAPTATPTISASATTPTPRATTAFPSATPAASMPSPTSGASAASTARCGTSPRPRLGSAPTGDVRLRLVSPAGGPASAFAATEVDYTGEWAGLGERDVFVLIYSYLDTKYWPTLRAGYAGSGDALKSVGGTFKGLAVIAAPEVCYDLVPVAVAESGTNRVLRDLIARTVADGPSRNYPGLTVQELQAVGSLLEGDGATVIRSR